MALNPEQFEYLKKHGLSAYNLQCWFGKAVFQRVNGKVTIFTTDYLAEQIYRRFSAELWSAFKGNWQLVGREGCRPKDRPDGPIYGPAGRDKDNLDVLRDAKAKAEEVMRDENVMQSGYAELVMSIKRMIDGKLSAVEAMSGEFETPF